MIPLATSATIPYNFLFGGLETGERRCGGGDGDDYKARVKGVHEIEKQSEKIDFTRLYLEKNSSSIYLNVFHQEHP